MALASTFAALGDPTRLAIFERLLQSGAQSAGQLQDISEITAPAISRHLKVLRKAGLVTQTVDKQRRIYAIEPASIEAINDWMSRHEAFWNHSLDRLARALEEEA